MVAVFQPGFVFPKEPENKNKRKNQTEECRFEKLELRGKKKKRIREEEEGAKKPGRNTRQQWIAEGLSLTLGWPGFTHCCWPPSSTGSRLLTSMR